jgi:YHS domain-containing protein
MFVHYDPATKRVVQLSSGAQPFAREGLAVAVIMGLPPDEGGGYAIDPASLTNAVTDPVGGVVFDPKDAVRTYEHGGKTYHFASLANAVKFFVNAEACLAERPDDGAQWQCGSVVALPKPPPPPPTLWQVKAARDAELAATDAYMMPDRPMTDWAHEEWRAYRQKLRDLGSLSTADAMVAAWPVRPDGRDAIADMRASQ